MLHKNYFEYLTYRGGRMSYIKSFFSSAMIAAVFLTSSFCFADIQEANASIAIQSLDTLSDNLNESGLQTSIRPPQWSNNRLAFTFDASQLINASGTYTGYVTFPNQTRYAVNGVIGTSGYPITLEIGAPTLLGTYTMTFVVTSLSGSIDHTQGPFGIAQNLTNNDFMQSTFDVDYVGDQKSATFLNRQ